MPVQAIETRRLYRQIADQIEALIGAGEFSPGERLPPERDLAAKLGVSRATVREAMIALELAGLVDIRIGSGIYVCERRANGQTTDDPGPGPFELIDARRAIESGTAALAAVHATDEELAVLNAALETMRREVAGNEASEDGDRLFHLGIASATHNALLARTVAELWEWRRGPMWTRLNDNLYMRRNRRRWIQDHERILDALRRHDADAAQAAMRDHLTHVKDALLKAMDANG
jgi:DNA-binding FadR family transcriptional regulator